MSRITFLLLLTAFIQVNSVNNTEGDINNQYIIPRGNYDTESVEFENELTPDDIRIIQTEGPMIVDKVAKLLDECAYEFDKANYLLEKSIKNNDTEIDIPKEILESITNDVPRPVAPSSLQHAVDGLKSIIRGLFYSETKSIPQDKETTNKTWKAFDWFLENVKSSCHALPSEIYDQIIKDPPTGLIKKRIIQHIINTWGQEWGKLLHIQMQIVLKTCAKDINCQRVTNAIASFLTKASGISDDKVYDLEELIQEIQVNEIVWKFLEEYLLVETGLVDRKPEEEQSEKDTDAENLQSSIASYFVGILKYPFQHFRESRVTVEVDQVLNIVPEYFLSFALEAYDLGSYRDFDLKSTRFRTLIKGLSPAIFRIGGTSANYLSFNPNETNSNNHKGGNGRIQKRNAEFEEFAKRYTMHVPKNHPKYESFKRTQQKFASLSAATPRFKKSVQSYGMPRVTKGTPPLTKEFKTFTLSGETLNELLGLTEASNLTLLFDLNQRLRDSDYKWDPTNAKLLLEHVAKNFPNANVIWQLGNEPNSYLHHYNQAVTPQEASEDFRSLRSLLEEIFPPTPLHLVGPDVTRPKHVKTCLKSNKKKGSGGSCTLKSDDILRQDSMMYLEEFLKLAHQDVDAVTWHQYYLQGITATVEDFIDPNVVDKFIKQINEVKAIKDKYDPSKQIWLTETSSASGGGAEDLSNRFISGFLWLAKLGESAARGVSVVARQSIYSGKYALLDEEYYPLPDYWLSLLYKRLVGQKVFKVSTSRVPSTVRLYAHCMNPKHQDYKTGALVVYGSNADSAPVSVKVDVLQNISVQKYMLTPLTGLQSRDVQLNGRVLVMQSDETLPKLTPVEENSGNLQFEATSFGFWVIQNAEIGGC